MSLRAEDVINKRFKPKNWSVGYDQDEVDDFLDEVVLYMRHYQTNNNFYEPPFSITSKTFRPTKWREGYDQDEVDNFLDELNATVETIREKWLQKDKGASETATAAVNEPSAQVAEEFKKSFIAEQPPVSTVSIHEKSDQIIELLLGNLTYVSSQKREELKRILES